MVMWVVSGWRLGKAMRSDGRDTMMGVFRTIALQGLSTLPDIHRALRQKVTTQALNRVTSELAERRLLRREMVYVTQGGRIVLASLTDDGRDFIEDELQQSAVESDWEKLERGHEGERFPRHTASVLAFAYHARLRGWQVEVMPEAKDKVNAVPDVWVSNDDETYYVEVEVLGKGGSRKRRRKWALSYNLQERLAVCTPDRNRRRIAVAEIRERHFAGVATDLATLTANERAGSTGNLWLERWSW
jgi:hypothetical protein